MRRLRSIWLGLLAVIGLSMLVTAQPVSAKTNAESVPLSVIPVTNEYQVNTNTGFYDLEMKPGKSTEILVKLANSGKTPITVNLQVVSATTSASSQISYANQTKTYDSSNQHPLPTLFNIPKAYQNLKIPGYSTAIFHMPMTMPAKEFKGVILGALRVTPVVKKATTAGIHNTYGYSVAVRLSNGLALKPDLKLNQVAVANSYPGLFTSVLGT